MIQMEMQPYFAGTFNGRPIQKRIVVLGEEIAADLINQWTALGIGMNPDCGPGIWLVRDVIPQFHDDGRPKLDIEGRSSFKPATDDEFQEMWEADLQSAIDRQAAWADVMIGKGDMMGDDPKQRPYIPLLSKQLARHYGRERAWLQELKDGDVRPCRFCFKSIDSRASVCPFCRQVVKPKEFSLESTTAKQELQKTA